MPNQTFSRLLIVELADIGNLILITPALSALRETFPTAQIDVLTTPHAAPILTGTGLADSVITFDKVIFDRMAELMRPRHWRSLLMLALTLRRGQYDAVLFFHHMTTRLGALKYAALAIASGAPRRFGLDNGRGRFLTDRVPDGGFGVRHEAQYWLDIAALLGAHTQDARLHVGISESDQNWAAEQLALLQPDTPVVAIHAGSGNYSVARRWEPEKFAALADRLNERGTQIVLVGGSHDNSAAVVAAMNTPPALNLTGRTTLGQLAAILAHCDRFFGSDSGVMHLAAAAGIQVTALFGPSNHEAWQPWTPDEPHANLVRTGTRCSPCFYVGHSLGLREGCAARTCLKTLSVDQVLSQTVNKTDAPVDPQPAPFATITILGLPIHALTFDDLLDQIGQWVKGDRTRQICTTNPEFLMAARRDSLFTTVLTRADLRIPDGVGLLWAARRAGRSFPARVTGSDGVPLIAERAAKAGWRLFFLGAAPGIAATAAQKLTDRYPGLQVVGVYAGSPAPEEEDEIVARINASGADILFVAYGAPIQDKWIARNLHRLQPRVAMGVGGSFDFIAGTIHRAPAWMRQLGIEWLHRLVQQPWRWRRMTRLPRFVLAVLLTG